MGPRPGAVLPDSRPVLASALTVAGLDLGLIVAMAAGLLSFIPYVGSITGGVTAIGLALAQFPDWHGVIVVAACWWSARSWKAT